jgi:SPP1 gp7 family putative phage head morphogenesis protein
MASKEIQLIKQSALDLFDESEDLARFAAEVLGDVNKKLTSSIVGVSGTELEKTVTIQGMQALQKEVGLHLATATLSLERHGLGVFERVYQQQFESILRQATLFEAASNSGIPASDMAKLAKLRPRLSGGLIKATFEGSLEKLSESAQTLKDPLRRVISQNVLTGGSYSDLIKGIKGSGIDKGVFKTVEHRARAIAITETTNIHSFARYESVVASNRILDKDSKLEFQWWAILDSITSKRCRSLHKQVRAQGKDFVAADGWRGHKPAAHPHCRSILIAYRRAWAGILEELDRDLKAQ